MRRSSAARRRTASSSTTAIASARRTAAARSCRPRPAAATGAGPAARGAVGPRALRVAYERGASGAQIVEAVIAGYEVAICLARACAPDLRQRGFHPTSAVGPFGAAVAVAKLRGLSSRQIADALGIAASASAGLFAFVNGGADIKRLHAGHASREG